MVIRTVHIPADHRSIGLLPNLSMVDGVNHVPMAKTVFITAASSWDRKSETPTLEKMMVL